MVGGLYGKSTRLLTVPCESISTNTWGRSQEANDFGGGDECKGGGENRVDIPYSIDHERDDEGIGSAADADCVGHVREIRKPFFQFVYFGTVDVFPVFEDPLDVLLQFFSYRCLLPLKIDKFHDLFFHRFSV
jgi:hypothetical protein